MIVIVAILVFGISGWFVLTAKSVFVEVNPITANIEINGGFYIRLGQRYLIRKGLYFFSQVISSESNKGFLDSFIACKYSLSSYII